MLLYFLLYRRIDSVAKITVWLWVGTMITVLGVIFSGALHFDSKIAFDFPPKAFSFSLGFLSGLGAATSIGIYDYLGYYDVCYIGEEVRNPGKVIPRSIVLSVLGVAFIYLLMNFSIIGVVPWKSFVCGPRRRSRRDRLDFHAENLGNQSGLGLYPIDSLDRLRLDLHPDAGLLARAPSRPRAMAASSAFSTGCIRRRIFRTFL